MSISNFDQDWLSSVTVDQLLSEIDLLRESDEANEMYDYSDEDGNDEPV